jgi:hypothetical protein
MAELRAMMMGLATSVGQLATTVAVLAQRPAAAAAPPPPELVLLPPPEPVVLPDMTAMEAVGYCAKLLAVPNPPRRLEVDLRVAKGLLLSQQDTMGWMRLTESAYPFANFRGVPVFLVPAHVVLERERTGR